MCISPDNVRLFSSQEHSISIIRASSIEVIDKLNLTSHYCKIRRNYISECLNSDAKKDIIWYLARRVSESSPIITRLRYSCGEGVRDGQNCHRVQEVWTTPFRNFRHENTDMRSVRRDNQDSLVQARKTRAHQGSTRDGHEHG